MSGETKGEWLRRIEEEEAEERTQRQARIDFRLSRAALYQERLSRALDSAMTVLARLRNGL